jgi:hypothetical protein
LLSVILLLLGRINATPLHLNPKPGAMAPPALSHGSRRTAHLQTLVFVLPQNGHQACRLLCIHSVAPPRAVTLLQALGCLYISFREISIFRIESLRCWNGMSGPKCWSSWHFSQCYLLGRPRSHQLQYLLHLLRQFLRSSTTISQIAKR